jgi:hypothetical protein
MVEEVFDCVDSKICFYVGVHRFDISGEESSVTLSLNERVNTLISLHCKIGSTLWCSSRSVIVSREVYSRIEY